VLFSDPLSNFVASALVPLLADHVEIVLFQACTPSLSFSVSFTDLQNKGAAHQKHN